MRHSLITKFRVSGHGKKFKGFGYEWKFFPCGEKKKNWSKHLGYVLLTLKRCSQASTLDEETDLILSFD